MELTDTARRLARRWYVILPGLIIALVASIVMWTVVQPEYERTATQLLLPGEGTLPRDATNPFLFLGGLTSVADVVVRAAGSEEFVGELTIEHPEAEVNVSRDPLNAGPAILVTVRTSSDEAAESIINAFVDRTPQILVDLQSREGIPVADQITVTTITKDRTSTLHQRKRLILAAGSGMMIIVLTLFAAAGLNGLSRRRTPDQAPSHETKPSINGRS